jgi:hypothetical protein
MRLAGDRARGQDADSDTSERNHDMSRSPSIHRFQTLRTRLLAAGAVAAIVVAGTAVAQTATPADPAPTAQAAPQSVTPAPGAGMQPGHGMHGHGGHGGRGGHHDRADRGERMFQQLDADRDGKLSRAEFEAGQKAMMERSQRAFDTADADRDGSLSVAERRAFRDAMHARMGGQDGSSRRRGGAPVAPAAPIQPGS